MITDACKYVIELKMKAVDEFIEKYVEPLLDIGSPEKLIGKPYNEWTPQDFQMLSMIYGDKFEKFIFKKEYESVLEEENA